MTEFNIEPSSIPSLEGKVALVTGGASGIGLAVVQLMLSKGAVVHCVDIIEPDDEEWTEWKNFRLHKADVRIWSELLSAFEATGKNLSFVFANAGAPVTNDDEDFLEDGYDYDGRLVEPIYAESETNWRGVLNTVKIGWSVMRRNETKGSIVITTASTGYSPERSLPVWSATQAAHISFVRSMRHAAVEDNITINAVAPAAVVTRMLRYDKAVPMIKAGLQMSSVEQVALALVYSAVARQPRRVEVYGQEPNSNLLTAGRWNGRVIMCLGNRYIECEERLAELKKDWFDEPTLSYLKQQKALTDFKTW